MLVTEVKPGFIHQDESSPESLLKLAQYTGDERYIGLAEAKLAQLDAIPERELLRIEILHARHAFKAGEKALHALLLQQPENRKALLMLAANQRQRGLIKKAKQSCTRLLFLDQTLSQDCLYAATLGQSQHRFKLSDKQPGQAENNLWRDLLRSENAEIQGDTESAQNIYQSIWRRSEPITIEAWLQYAHFLKREGENYQLKKLLRFAPANPELMALRATVDTRVDVEGLSQQIAMQERHPFARNHAAEIAWFHHLHSSSPQWALHWARINWQTQRSLRDAELLAKTALVAGEQAPLIKLKAWMTHHNIEDQRLQELLQNAPLQQDLGDIKNQLLGRDNNS